MEGSFHLPYPLEVAEALRLVFENDLPAFNRE